MDKEQIQGKEFLARGKRGTVSTGFLEIDGKKVKVAIKEKRPDSEAMGRMQIEAQILPILNKYGIGPKFIGSGENFLVYEFVKGKFVEDFVRNNEKSKIQDMLIAVFNQMFVLDKLGVNKEEMHHPVKHIIIDEVPVLIDFERCTHSEKVKNVTQFIQFVTSSSFGGLLSEKGFDIDTEKLRKLGAEYKNSEEKDECFDKILTEIR